MFIVIVNIASDICIFYIRICLMCYHCAAALLTRWERCKIFTFIIWC